MTRIAVLVSGGGTNLQALIDAQGRGELKNGVIAAVISSRADAFALERAARAGIPGYVVSRKDYGSNREMTAALVEQLRGLEIGLVVLAGFLHILTEEMVQAYPNAILNVHPALIPSFCGTGYDGLHVHEKALDYGVKVSRRHRPFSSTRSRTAVPSYCKRRWTSGRTTRRRRSSAGSWSSVSGASCPGPYPCSARAASMWRGGTSK